MPEEYDPIKVMESILTEELTSLEGIHRQNPETGRGGFSGALANYSNKLFGAPYQLLDTVDKRFDTVNPYVGSEYLRNFLLYSPILHIKPGMPRYTGGSDGLGIIELFTNAYKDVQSDNTTFMQSMLLSLAKMSPFSKGATLQRRMFGFRETYVEYMQYVNYMCRSMAIFLGLADNELDPDKQKVVIDSPYPQGTFINTAGGERFDVFQTLRWENYRMMVGEGSYIKTVTEHIGAYIDTNTMLGTVKGVLGSAIEIGGKVIDFAKDAILNAVFDTEIFDGVLDTFKDSVQKAFDTAGESTMYDVASKKITSLMFLVEPVAFTESLSNTTGESFIESTVGGISEGIGSEIAFFTNSRADNGIIEGLVGFLGDTVGDAALNLGKLIQPVTGSGYLSNLFSGALKSLKGQKMIYPEIYKSSKSTMDYEYTITLTTPYGDLYNYYMNIVVPLMHLIGLAAPRMITSNTTASPFLVQSYIPGMCTCELGIVKQMTIVKNPSAKHVSVHGFPLTVRVNFTIGELYNAMAISPAHDPASFLFNETLNDYMCNLAGLIPSLDTYSKQRKASLGQVGNYFSEGIIADEFFSKLLERFENGTYLTGRY